ncbi:MAG: ATP-binding protein [Treponema sp.]|jgi:predicted ATP-binding protein involved in virulence|nr:ATP-binding protein [Treponema sp.]
MNFPYINQIIVHNCYASKGFNIPKEPLGVFKHIVLTGKNGSGKTTILNRIGLILNYLQDGKTKEQAIRSLADSINIYKNNPTRSSWEQSISELKDIDIIFLNNNFEYFSNNEPSINLFFKAHRRIELQEVKTVTIEEDFLSTLNKHKNTDDFTKLFKQYLVNKKVYEAFDYMGNKTSKINQSQLFFSNLKDILGNVLEDKGLELVFVQESFEFYIILSDGRKITFNNLSEGFSAFLSVVMDLLTRTDLIRKQKDDFQYQPNGIVLIDEPETHLHLSMQYNMLPLLSSLFPNIQFIIATHSPAVISSLENTMVYDLTSKNEVADDIIGSSYSELMINHFGLTNEYSPIVSKIFEEVNIAAKNKDTEALRSVLAKYETFLTPALKLDIEFLLIKIKNGCHD